MPSKIKEVFSWAPFCDPAFFTAYDPPSALTSVSAVAAPILPDDPEAPVSSVTLDPPSQSTTGSKKSTPLPASIPKVDQPKATIAGTLNPAQKETLSTKPLANDPAPQESSLSQAQVVKPNGDHKGGGSPQQSSDHNHGNDPKPQHNNTFTSDNHPGQPSDHSHGSDPTLQQDDDPKQGNGPSKASNPSHRIDPNRCSDPIAGSEPRKTADIVPHNNSADDQAGNTNKQTDKSASGTHSTPASSPAREAPPITPSGTETLKSGDSTTEDLDHAAHTEPPDRTTTINGHAITANSTALTIADTVLTPGAPALSLNGTVLSFDTAAQLVLGTKTILLELERPSTSGEMAGASGSAGSTGTNSLATLQGNISMGARRNGTGVRVQGFKGDAGMGGGRGRFLGTGIAVMVFVMAVLGFV